VKHREPFHSDYLNQIRVYAEFYNDPDYYVIWFAGFYFLVDRMLDESGFELYSRVCDSIQLKRKHISHCRKAFAHVYAGVIPTKDEIFALEQEDIRQAFRDTMQYGKTSMDRVNAAIMLGKHIGMYPHEI
jgi:hypothetical protein